MIERRYLKIAETILYIYASLLFFYFVYIFAADFQDFSHTFKMAGAYLAFLLPTYLLFIVHLLLYPKTPSKLKKTYQINGFVFAGVAALSLLLIIINLATGNITSFVEGSLTSLYPCDVVILDVINIALGVCLSLFGAKLFPADGALYCPSDIPLWKTIVRSILRPLYVFFSLYTLGAFLFGLGMAYYSGAYFGYMIPAYLLMLLAPAFLGYYEWGYREVPEEQRSKKRSVLYFGISFGSVTLLAIFHFVFLALQPDFFLEQAIAYFPLDFMGSVNAAPLVLIAPLFIASLTGLLVSLFQKAE